MSLTSWLRESFCRLGTANRKRRRAARSAPLKRTRPQLESLEDRRVPAYAMTALYLSEAVDLNEAGQVVGYAGEDRKSVV